MSFTFTLDQSLRLTGETIATSQSITSNSVLKTDEDVPANTTDLQVNLSFTLAEIEVFYMLSVTNAMIVTINDPTTGAPDQIINLTAGQPLQWAKSSAFANPINQDVTVMYLTVADPGSLFRFRLLSDLVV